MGTSRMLVCALLVLNLLAAGAADACSLSFTAPARGSTVVTAQVGVAGTGSGTANQGDVGQVTATLNGVPFFQQSGTFTTHINFLGSGAASVTLQPGPNVFEVHGSVNGCSASDSMWSTTPHPRRRLKRMRDNRRPATAPIPSTVPPATNTRRNPTIPAPADCRWNSGAHNSAYPEHRTLGVTLAPQLRSPVGVDRARHLCRASRRPRLSLCQDRRRMAARRRPMSPIPLPRSAGRPPFS
nr:hypothetical protein [Methylocaldum marinum]